MPNGDKGRMYQSVDDQDEIDFEEAQELSERRALMWKFVIGAVIILALVIIFGRPTERAAKPADTAQRAERASYHMAITEPSAALRRARLKDFQTTYPESPRQAATTAQLTVLSQHETRSWAAVLDAQYDPGLSMPEKLSAIQHYEAEWGRAYLGSREAEISALRESLNDDAPLPDRKLKGGPSPIPKTINDRVMVGGPRAITPRPVAPRPQALPVAPKPAAPAPYVAEITRNVTPRYPSRAQRRGVEAVVELSLDIDERGRVKTAELIAVDSDGGRYERDFIRAAERAAMRTRYEPYVVNGEPVAVFGINKRYRFTMGE